MYIGWNDGKGNFSDQRISKVPVKIGWKQTIEQGNSGIRVTLVQDVNGDGKPDIIGVSSKDPLLANMYRVQGGRPRIWLNQGKGFFKESTDKCFPKVPIIFWPRYIYGGDLDCDGDKDIIVASAFHPVRVFFNDGNGVFKESSFLDVPSDGRSPLTWAMHIKTGDLDGDGDLDVVVGTAGLGPKPNQGMPILVFMNDGEGRLSDETSSRVPVFPFSVSVHTRYVDLQDLDGDGDLDILFHWGTSYVLWNNGKGFFPKYGFSPVPSSYRWVWLDLDGDGDNDAVSAPGGGCYENLGKGRYKFRRLANPPGFQGIASLTVVSDVDRDGREDLVCVDYNNSLRNGIWVFRNVGRWQFTLLDHPKTGLMGKDYIRVKDLDGDGYPDIVGRSGWILRNDRAGHFHVVPETGDFLRGFRQGIVFSCGSLDQFEVKDLDGDGLPEIITAGNGIWDWNSGIPGWYGEIHLWKNLGDFHFRIESHKWLEIRGVGMDPYWGQVMEIVDIDQDGDPDLLYQPYGSILNIRYNLREQCALSGVLGIGKKALVKVFGIPGDQVALFGGIPGKSLAIPGLGTWRLGTSAFLLMAGRLQSQKDRFNALMKWEAMVPKNPVLIGAKLRFQALIQRPGRGAFLTGSDTGIVNPY